MERSTADVSLEGLRDFFDKFLISRRYDSDDMRQSLCEAVFNAIDKRAEDDLTDPFGNPFTLVANHIQSVSCHDTIANVWYVKLNDEWTKTSSQRVHEIGVGVVNAYVNAFEIPLKACNSSTRGLIQSKATNADSF